MRIRPCQITKLILFHSPIIVPKKLQPLPPGAMLGSAAGPPLPPGSVGTITTGRSRGRTAKTSANPALPSESTSGTSTAMSAQTLAMAKFLGMNLQTDTQLMWIAQEALLAKLPEGYGRTAYKCCSVPRRLKCHRWTEQRSDDGAVFFHHRGSGRSSWEHPKDAYFRFLCAAPPHTPATAMQCMLTCATRYLKFSNMKKGGKVSNDGQNGKDRQMVDMYVALSCAWAHHCR